MTDKEKIETVAMGLKLHKIELCDEILIKAIHIISIINLRGDKTTIKELLDIPKTLLNR